MENRKKLTSILDRHRRKRSPGLRLGTLLRVCRLMRGWSLEKTARSLGVSVKNLRQLESSARPDLALAAKAVEKLGGSRNLAVSLYISELRDRGPDPGKT